MINLRLVTSVYILRLIDFSIEVKPSEMQENLVMK